MSKLNTILVVEDDKVMRQMLRDSLDTDGFIVLEASKGQRSIEILKQHKVDTVLLDLALPDAKGLEYISAIRECTNVPLIIVSGEEEEGKKIGSLEQGADDFISKPINFNMLIAKIKAHLRRYEFSNFAINEKNSNRNKQADIKLGNWVLNKEQFQLFDAHGDSANLTIKEFLILNALIQNAERTLTRSELCSVIQEKNYIPSDRAIDVKVARIRKKIGDDAVNSKIIQTIRGAGYKLNA